MVHAKNARSFPFPFIMDSSLYKDLTVSRGIKYHYYYSAPQDDKPTLLLCHGFPNSSRDWKQQVAFFKNEGYGLVVPDMIGYAGTDAPEDTALYAHSLISKDLIELLDAEKVEKVIGVGHDWYEGPVYLGESTY